MAPRRGRPPTPLNPEASCNAKLGAELRHQREAAGMTLEDLAAVIGFSPQRISDIERAKATPSQPFITACEDALHADETLLPLLSDTQRERDTRRQERADARREARQAEADPSLPCEDSESGDDDVRPTTRLGLLEAGAAAALGAATVGPVPTRAAKVDPALVDHWTHLLALLGRVDTVYGPREVLAAVTREIELITGYRNAARGHLRIDLMRVESRWCEFAAWLSNDTGDTRSRDAWTDRAASLAQTTGYADMAALARERRAQWSAQEHDARRTIAFAEDALRIPGTSAQTRALCVRQAACGHALGGDIGACERRLAEVEHIMDCADATEPPWTGGLVDHHLVGSGAARCWLALEPRKAVALYETVLRDWPRERVRTGGLHQARYALACAVTGELDRARAEGRKAAAVMRATKSTGIARELQRLGQVLKAA